MILQHVVSCILYDVIMQEDPSKIKHSFPEKKFTKKSFFIFKQHKERRSSQWNEKVWASDIMAM